MNIYILSLLVFSVLHCEADNRDDFYYGTFPDDFIWGTATSAYQIEGGWNDSGKTPNIWDTWTQAGGNVANNDTGDVACDSYNKYEEDVQLMKAMNVDFYRFSISWARVMTDGVTENADGVQYYNNLIDELIAKDIKPMATLYHWDLPQALQDKGGWENEELIEDFKNYADLCFRKYGDRVKWWLTFNEPWVVTWLGYGIGIFAPGVNSADVGVYRAAHTIIKSHAEAYHLYDEEYRPTQQGQISITLDSDWKEPLNDDPENIEAAERAMQFKLGWYAHPIFVNGNYPQIMIDQVANKSASQGLNESRLPVFTEEEQQKIVGTHDYFGLNHYTTQYIQNEEKNNDWPSYESDQDTIETQDDDWPSSGSSWLKVVPWGLRKLLVFIKNNYNNPRIIVTENGMSDRNSTIQDDHRIYYYRHYINEMLKAIDLDEVDVFGYTAWSLMDNFEWGSGYDEKFGLHWVNFTDPARPRVPKASSVEYRKIIDDNGFPDNSRDSASGLLANPISIIALVIASLWVALPMN